MEFLKNVGRAVGEAAGYLREKNRRAAQLSRLRTVIHCHEKAAQTEYLALGRYYYNNLRDKDNPVTEPHCAALDQVEESLDRALKQLETFYSVEDDGREEITLDDVAVYEQDPTAVEEPVEQAAPEQAAVEPETSAPEKTVQEAYENLPFEG